MPHMNTYRQKVGIKINRITVFALGKDGEIIVLLWEKGK